jgi:hypothetical protein
MTSVAIPVFDKKNETVSMLRTTHVLVVLRT